MVIETLAVIVPFIGFFWVMHDSVCGGLIPTRVLGENRMCVVFRTIVKNVSVLCCVVLCCVLPAHSCVLTGCSDQCYFRTNVIWDTCYFRLKSIVLNCVLQSPDRLFGQTLAFSFQIEIDDSSQCTWDKLAARLHCWLRSKLIILRNALFVSEEGLACLRWTPR